ncbi:MAG TPA: DNA-3-methyladenine glycosylase 2 family protein [Gammaproteobacteria bacterium]|nr:DNA-3-methyladenine glycosylase 2 family protein [Gammaproteobacteria bacterium]
MDETVDRLALHADFVRTARRISRRFARAVDAAGPLAPPSRRRTPLPAYLARVIVGQQLSTTAARTIWGRLEAQARAAGRALPAYAAEAPLEVLRNCGLSGNKVRALQALAAADAAGALAAPRLKVLSSAARLDALLALHGIGPWTAQMAALFWFREPDIWPVGDVSVRKTFGAYVVEQSRWSFDEAAALFAPRRSFLARYLWQIADATP